MRYLRHRIVIPESHSFQINKQYQEQNTDIIHSHQNFELNYVVNGRGRRFIGGNISIFGPGDLVLMGPNLPHCWEADSPEDQYISITIHFKEDLFDSKLFSIPEFSLLHRLLEKSKYGIHFVSINSKEIEKKLEDLRQMHGYASMVQMLKLLGDLTEVLDSDIISNAELNVNLNHFESERFNRVCEFVFRNFHHAIKLEDVAKEAHLSESSFCTYFKKQTKKTFSTFLKEIRIQYACKLLSYHPDMNIAQICYESGYNNVGNFNRQFREIIGMSPREYRSKYHVRTL